MEDRPALLRKDFLIDEYQIYEARAYGADTVLLIVASLEETKLRQMVEISRSLGMEPLVEVNTDAEMEIALHSGAKVIGINNRNLHSFQVDMETTNKLLKGHTLSEDVIVAALSGITSRADVEHFEKAGARAVLVGEALMRTSNPAQKILVRLPGLSSPSFSPFNLDCAHERSHHPKSRSYKGFSIPSSKYVALNLWKWPYVRPKPVHI
jgi:anthranilate synthase/indole-3-glycerol phosphate synthase/phosphoribosylanthranilate isomerase